MKFSHFFLLFYLPLQFHFVSVFVEFDVRTQFFEVSRSLEQEFCSFEMLDLLPIGSGKGEISLKSSRIERKRFGVSENA